MHYPPIPQRKNCNCEDPCISTDDVYYAGPNLPNSGVNTNDILTEVIEKLDAIYAVPTLQRVTEMGNYTTIPIIADSFVKIGGDGTNLLLDNGDVLAIDDLPIPTFNPSDYDLDEFTNNGIDPFAHISDIPASILSALPFTTDHLSATNNQYVIGDLVWYLGNVYRCIANNDSILPTSTSYWTNIGAGYPIVQQPADWNSSSGNNQILNKPTIPAPLGYTPVNKAGDTMLGDLILNADPSTALQAATKQYVDNIAGGITFRSPVFTATTGNLNATYNNGASGVGATLTSNVNGFIEIDQEFPGILERVLVWKQGTQVDNIENGIYEVTDTGSLTTPFILTRTSDADNTPAGELSFGDYTFVLSGATNGGRGFICNTAITIVIGITPISFVQFNTAQVTTPGYGLQDGASPGIIEINTSETQEKIAFTTTGTGAATFIGNALNIPTLPQATTSVDGYLSSTDWNTFNNKENSSNKQNSLAIDGTGTKFPTVDAVNAGLISSQYWTKTGDNIQNNNIGNTQVKLLAGKQFQLLNSLNTIVGFIDETGLGRFGAASTYTAFGPANANVHLSMVRSQMNADFTLGNPSIAQAYTIRSSNNFGTNYWAGSAEVSASAVAEHSFNIGNSIGNGITSGIFRISRTRVQSTVPVKYATDLSGSYDDRTLVDKAYVDSSITNSNYWTKVGNNIYNNTGGVVLARGIAGGYYEDAFKGQFLQAGVWVDGFRVQNGGNFYYAYGYGQYSSANTFGNASGSVQMSTTSNNAFISNVRIKYLTDLSSSYDDRTLVDKAYVDSKRPYKVYSALLTQTGVTAPTAIVLENTLGGAVTFTYVSPGTYYINSSSLFTIDKTSVIAGNLGVYMTSYRVTNTTTTINLFTSASTVYQDEGLAKTFLEIRVYN